MLETREELDALDSLLTASRGRASAHLQAIGTSSRALDAAATVACAHRHADDPTWPEVLAHLTRHYGGSPYEWGEIMYYRLEPSWMVAYASGD